MSEKSEPYRCLKCIAEGGYNGLLRFPGDPTPVCRTHDIEMEPVDVKPEEKE